MSPLRASRLLARLCCGCGDVLDGEAAIERAWCTYCRDRWGTVPGWWQAEPGGVPGWAAARYGGPVRHAVLAAKRGSASGLAAMLVARLPRECLPRDAVVTWIPAHPRRAVMAPDSGTVLARAVAGREQLHARALLRRSVFGHRQAGQGPDVRRAQGAQLGLRVRRGVRLPAAVVVVDDVRTTGATLDHAAELLREAGVRHVMGVTAVLAGTPA